MKTLRTYSTALISTIALLGCGKGELDPGTLTNNPFDPDYNGPAVFELDTTFLEVVVIPGATLLNQAIVFHAKAELFLSDAAYSVRVVDQMNGLTYTLDPNPTNTDRFKYVRSEPVIGAPVCLELRLFNNQSAARAEQICATLQ
ncbi:MAG: hypothetical protein IPI81_16985 [Flavobacteriales bacterium]|nr:hypothetical protein [Flavobacteriales bacterium]MCC6938748.1 hypothetical protein [Flavobacteriales bacterium]